MLRYIRNIPGDAKPMVFQADEIVTWSEDSGSYQVVYLRGQVLIQHGVAQIRCQHAVGWLDIKGFKERGIWRLDLYCEDQVQLDISSEVKSGGRALVELHTRGELKLLSQRSKLGRQSMGGDPLVQRGNKERQAIALTAAAPRPTVPGAPVTQVGASVPLAPMAPPTAATPLLAPPPPSKAPTVLPPAGAGRSSMLYPPVAPAAPGAPASLLSEGQLVRSSTPAIQRISYYEAPTGASGTGGVVVGLPTQTLGLIPADLTSVGTLGTGVAPIPNSAPVSDQPIQLVQAPGPGTLQPGPVPPGGGIPAPLPPPSQPARPPTRAPVIAGGTATRNYAVSARSGETFHVDTRDLPNGEQALIITGGVILSVRGAAPGIGIVDIEADQLVIFKKGDEASKTANNIRQPEGETSKELEFYLSGNVEIREMSPKAPNDARILRAVEVYYDVNRNVAVARQASLEMHQGPKANTGSPSPIPLATGQQSDLQLVLEPLFIKADEMFRTSETTYEAEKAEIFSSKLPSDPGLEVYVTHATIEDKTIPKKTIFGTPVIDRKTGQQLQQQQTLVYATDVFFELEHVPIFYLPYTAFDAQDPLGPVNNFMAGYNRIFGAELGFSVDMFQLLGLQREPGERWRTDIDYLSRRGPALGTTFQDAGKDILGIPAQQTALVKGYLIYDHGTDILGGDRDTNLPPFPPAFDPTNFRGRAMWRENVQELPDGFSFQSQVYYLSDRNFLEQYYQNEFNNDLNPQTYAYVKQQQDDWAWTLEADGRLRSWVNESIWLPKADGYLIGQSFFNLFTYSAHASAGYGKLMTSNDPEPQVTPPTDFETNTSRLDAIQELDLPFQVAPFHVVPYLMLDTASYSRDVEDNEVGRVWGAAGVRTSLPFSRLYPDVSSELFNLDGINHKIVFSANYFVSQTNVHYYQLPQMDRLNDDATDMSLRDLAPNYPSLYPSLAPLLPSANPFLSPAQLNTPLYDPQKFAIRSVVLNRVDTLDDVDVLQMDINQRWQTKRGYPGMEHIIDWMTLDLSASFYPEKDRDDFGSYWGMLQYGWTWNVGDRTALVSSGYIDPFTDGLRYFTVGGYFNRSDRTSFYLGYAQIDPLESRAITASATYIFSPKYATTASITYDFGEVPVLSESLVLTRIGTDLQVSVGFSYNNLQNNFGFVFAIVPNLAANTNRAGGMASASALH